MKNGDGGGVMTKEEGRKWKRKEERSYEREGCFFVVDNLQVEDETQDREEENEQRPYPFKTEQVKTKTCE